LSAAGPTSARPGRAVPAARGGGGFPARWCIAPRIRCCGCSRWCISIGVPATGGGA